MKLTNSVHYSINHEAAVKYGVSGAMILNRIVWSQNYHIENGESHYFKDDRWWVCNTYESIADHYRGLISVSSVKSKILAFEKDGLVISKQINKANYNRTKWYSIDFDKWHELTNPRRDILTTIDKTKYNLPYRTDKNCPIEQTEINTIDKTENVYSASLNSPSNSLANSLTNNPPPAASLSAGLPVKYTAIDFSLASRWLDFAKEVMSWKKSPSGWNAESWANDLAKIKRVTDINDEGLIALFEFIKNDDFWMKNAMSPATLLKKGKNDLRKIDNILLKMRPTGDLKQKRFDEGIEEFLNETTPVPIPRPKPKPKPKVEPDLSWPDDPVPEPKNTTVSSSFSKGLSSFRKERKDRND